MNDLLFAVPWWIPTMLAVIGVALFINGNKSQVAKVRNAGAGLVGFAILWATVSFLVDTDKEKVEKGTREFVQSAVDGVASGDWSKFKSKMSPTVLFTAGGQSVSGPTVADIASHGAEFVKLRSAVVREMTTEQTANLISVHCDILTTEDFATPMENSSWQFDWEKTGEVWKVREIRLLKIKDIPDDQLDAVTRGGKR